MKIAGRTAIFAAAFCILVAAAGFCYYFIYDGGSSGHFAFAVELRMLAYDAADMAPGLKRPFIFQDADAREFIDTGEAPDGWKWVPVADFAQSRLSISRPISRTSNGQVFVLAADNGDLAVVLMHPVSVKLDTSSGDSPVPILKIRIGSGDTDVLSKFREVHGDDEVAIVIGSRICGDTSTSNPDLDRGVIAIWFPDGGEDAAKHLRDTLLSKKL
jgi:hypothetical protein